MLEDSNERTVFVAELDDRVTKELIEELFTQASPRLTQPSIPTTRNR